MKILFAPLLTVSVSHSYYLDGCQDFDFVVPPSTERLLRSGRMLARALAGRFIVLAERDALGAPIADLSGQTLYFGLRLNNRYFGNFTAPLAIDAGTLPLYANLAAPGAFDAPVGMLLVAGLYSHVPQLATRPVTLQLRDADGNLLDTRSLASGEEAASYDLRPLPAGRYRIDEDYGGGTTRSRALLLHPELRDSGVWGVLAVKIDATFYTTPAAFALAFSARQETLKYFVVADNYGSTEFDQLGVSDQGFGEEARSEITFDKVLPAAFTADDIAPALLGDGSARIALFQSQTQVARRERGFKQIQLARNGTVLVENLPLPGPERTQAHLIVHLSKP